jgi:putative transposase
MNKQPINPRFSLSDELWEQIKPLLPVEPPKPKGGRPRMDDRQAMTAILYVLRTGIQWNALPRSLGASSTVHDRFQYWEREGVFRRLWETGLQAYDEVKGIEWTWQAVDGAMTKAPLGGKRHRSQSNRPRQERNET